jgi:hypothetical protein
MERRVVTGGLALAPASPMTRSYGSSRSRRITQPIAPIVVARKPRDPAIDDLGFTCFRLVMGEPLELEHSTNSMFVFVRRRAA